MLFRMRSMVVAASTNFDSHPEERSRRLSVSKDGQKLDTCEPVLQ
jgi:hypothetical protein